MNENITYFIVHVIKYRNEKDRANKSRIKFTWKEKNLSLCFQPREHTAQKRKREEQRE